MDFKQVVACLSHDVRIKVREIAQVLPVEIADEVLELASSERDDDAFSRNRLRTRDELIALSLHEPRPDHPNPKRKRGTESTESDEIEPVLATSRTLRVASEGAAGLRFEL